MFVSRRQDGTIYGMWTVRQFEGQEELPDNHPEVLAGPVKLPPQTPDEIRFAADEIERQAAKIDAQILSDMNMTPAEVNSTVDTVFAGFSAAQRTFLKRLVRMVLAAARRVLRN